MKINIVKGVSGPDKNKASEQNYMIVNLSVNEALQLISSLSDQIRTGNANGNRPEMKCRSGDYVGYFSIAVEK